MWVEVWLVLWVWDLWGGAWFVSVGGLVGVGFVGEGVEFVVGLCLWVDCGERL